MFEKLEKLPADPILGLTDAFKEDTSPNKINLGVGIYKDGAGKTPVLESVKKAEEILLKKEQTKSYLSIEGLAEYGAAVKELLFGTDSDMKGRAVCAQTPGGTGALRIGGDFLHSANPNAKMWVSSPTWENHIGIFEAAGFEVKKYPYYDASCKCLDIEAMLNAIRQMAAGDVILLHACCHNPTGVDPTFEQWQKICKAVIDAKVVPFFDFAYQGFGIGLDEDANGLRMFGKAVPEILVASSFSKNFGLYNERVGALTVVAKDEVNSVAVLSHVKSTIRRMYSNPPSHGAAIVATIMNDAKLKELWLKELADMRDRINSMRTALASTLKQKGAKQDFSFITKQKGMFSFSGLAPDQVKRLRDKYAIYIVGSGRINVAGITKSNIDALCEAIAKVN